MIGVQLSRLDNNLLDGEMCEGSHDDSLVVLLSSRDGNIVLVEWLDNIWSCNGVDNWKICSNCSTSLRVESVQNVYLCSFFVFGRHWASLFLWAFLIMLTSLQWLCSKSSYLHTVFTMQVSAFQGGNLLWFKTIECATRWKWTPQGICLQCLQLIECPLVKIVDHKVFLSSALLHYPSIYTLIGL